MNEDERLHQKYVVMRMDDRDLPGGDKEGARYFVLDYHHDPIAQAALAHYIELARNEGHEPLADDLEASLKEVLELQGSGPNTMMPMDAVVIRWEGHLRLERLDVERRQRESASRHPLAPRRSEF